MPEIDELNIKIKAEASQATSALTNLIMSLDALGTALGKVGNYATSFDRVTESIMNMAGAVNSVNTEKLESISNALRNVSYASKGLASSASNLNFDGAIGSVGNLDKDIVKAGQDLATSFGIKGREATRQVIIGLNDLITTVESSKSGWDKIINEDGWRKLANDIADNTRILTGYERECKKVLDYINQFNKSGAKVNLDFNGVAEFRDAYNSMQKSLGKGFGQNNGGITLDTFITDMNTALGTTIQLTGNSADNFARLVEYVRQARDGVKGMSVDQAIRNGSLPQDYYDNVGSQILTVIEKLQRQRQLAQDVKTEMSTPPSGNFLEQLATSLQRLGSVQIPDNAKQITDFATAVNNLGTAKVQKATENLPPLAESLKKTFDVLSNMPTISQNTIQTIQAMGTLNTNAVRTTQNIPQLGNAFKGLHLPMVNLRHNTLSLAAAFGKFYASFWFVIRGINKFKSAITDAMDMGEVYNYFDASLKQIANNSAEEMGNAGTDSAEAYIDNVKKTFSNEMLSLTEKMTGYTVDEGGVFTSSMTTSLGINPTELMSYQAQFSQMASSMGVASEYAVKMSNALSELGADLASVKNMNFTDVWQNMSSGLAGMSRTMDKFGVNIRNAALQEKLAELNIDGTVSKLSAQDKALLRTIVMLDSTRYAWGDLAGTLDNSVANQLRALKASMASVSRTLGSMFLGSILKLLPYINAFTIALQRLLEMAIQVFGIEIPNTSSQASGNLEGLMDSALDVSDALDDASGSANKLKQNLLGIDELTVINSDSGSSSGVGGLGGISTDLQNAFDDIFNEYQKVWDEAYAKVKNDAQKMADEIVKAIQKGDWTKIGQTVANFIKDSLQKIDWTKIYGYADKIGAGFAQFLNGLLDPSMFTELGKTLASAINTAFHYVSSFVSNFDWINAGLTLASLVNGFAKTIDAKLIGETISNALTGALKLVKTFLKETDFYEIGKRVGELLASIKWYDFFVEVMGIIGSALVGVFEGLAGLIVGGLLTNPIQTICTLIATSFGAKIILAIGAIKMLPAINTLCNMFLGSPLYAQTGASIGNSIVNGISTSQAFTNITSTVTSAFNRPDIWALTGNEVGVAIAASIAAAIAGYGIGTLIYSTFIEDTKWDALGYDYQQELLAPGYAAMEQQLLEQSTEAWNKSLIGVANQLKGWEGFKIFEGTDVWAENIDTVNNALTILGQKSVDIQNVDAVTQALTDSTLDLNKTEMGWITYLSENYGALDDLTKSALYAQYGIGSLSGEYVELAGASVTLSDATGSTASTIEGLTTDFVNAQNAQQNFKDLNIDLVDVYGKENKAVSDMAEQYDFFAGTTVNTISSLKGVQTGFFETITATTSYKDALRIASDQMGDTSTATQLLKDNFDKLPTSVQKSIAEVEKLKLSSDKVTTSFFDNNVAMSDSSAGMTALADTMVVTNASFDDVAKTINTLTTSDIANFNKATEGMEKTATTATANIETGFNNMSTTISDSFTTAETTISETFGRIDTDSVSTLTRIRGQLGNIFMQSNVETELSGIEPAFTKVFGNVCKVIAAEFNKLIGAINSAFDVTWDEVKMGEETVLEAGSAKLINIKPIVGYATGGFPEDGLFFANHNELVGQFNGKTAVANNEQIIEGIKRGVTEAVASQMLPYLSSIASTNEEIAQKQFGITSSQAYNAVVYENNKVIRTTGASRLAF